MKRLDLIEAIPFSPSRLDASFFIESQLKKYLRNNYKILDVGSGSGYLLLLLSDLNYKLNYFGLDKQPKMFAFGSKLIEKKIIKADFLKFHSKRKFDIVTCLWVLEHIKKDTQAIENMPNYLKNSSVAIIAVPSIWSWPIEFGRHGFRYYTKQNIIKKATQSGFKVIKFYEAGGLLGLIFMIFYSWPRYLFLVPLYLIYKIIRFSKITNQSWPDFSKNFVQNTFYRYHSSKKAINIHNNIVRTIVNIDNKLKFMPASYVLVLEK